MSNKCQKISHLHLTSVFIFNFAKNLNNRMNLVCVNLKQILQHTKNIFGVSIRAASKKTGGSTQNTHTKVRPKHRGWKVQDGHRVEAGSILATQRHLRFHPGLNVGFGRNGTLFAMVPGRVLVTCEKVDLNWTHTWVQRCHGFRQEKEFFKKYFNILPDKQHQNFKLIDQL